MSSRAESDVGERCPLCGGESASPSWLGSTRYRGKEFCYVACRACQSLYCRPMPDAPDLESMYGSTYENSGTGAGGDPKEPEWVLSWLERLPPGVFTDYGCGDGELLIGARERGFEVLGVELMTEVVERTMKRTGLRVVAAGEALEKAQLADVLHAGDVLEHLTDLDREMPRILSLIKPGGLLLAQGPLEANRNLYTWTLRVARALKRRAPVNMPPYHVVLATAEGQWALFRRFGLAAVEKAVTEVSWPAPSRLSPGDLVRPRQVGLFALRLASRALSRLRSDRWGNRYRYAGRTPLLNP